MDLGSPKSISRVEIAPYSAQPYLYEVMASNNGTSYTQVVNRLGNTQGGDALTDEILPFNARYWIEKADLKKWWSQVPSLHTP